MKQDELELEMEVLSLMFFTTHDQAYMLKGFLSQKAKQDLNTWIKQGEKLLTSLNMGRNEDYMRTLTDTLHLQLDEVRKVIVELKKECKK